MTREHKLKDITEDAKAFRKRLKALIGFRAAFVTLLLGSSFIFKAGYDRFQHPHAFSYLIAALYILTFVYSILIERIKQLYIFAYTQLILDVVFGITLIYITGGIESWFSFMLVLIVISSSIVIDKRAGYIIATLSSFFYGILINLQFHGLLSLNSGKIMEVKDYLYNIFIHIVSFYLVAYLSGYLSSRLERTVKKLDEKATDLRELEFFNKEVIESLPSGLFTTDISGKLLTFNKAAEKIIGCERDSVIGRRIDEVLPYFKFPFVQCRREEVIKTNGVKKVIGFQITPLKDINGNNKGFIGIFQDLTDLKRYEAEIKRKEKLAAIGELSSNIAHEIRNPLASLKGSIEMLKDGTIPPDNRKRLMEIALKEMECLNRIITDFLTYSKPSQPEIRRFELHSILDETTELLKNVEQNKGNISIKKKYAGRLEIDADPQKLRQVFWNLGINAIEAMPKGGELVVSTKNTDDTIEIIFQDSGAGIAKQDMERVFYPFFTTKESGTGLGLSIAYRIIEEHSGKINVESNPGVGTTFEVILPKTDGKT
ncbi:MAG: PAS domain S-box protein [Nitrospirae bacterium]|nr:PAS domain S-box protein [Nitrospirota bacterium]